MNDYKNLLKLLFEKIERMRTETPSAGTRFRLMGLTADIWEVAETLQKNVTACVSKEAVLDADIDVNYAELSEQVLALELEESPAADDAINEQVRLMNEALGELSRVLAEIDDHLSRHHKDEEYVRLYEQEKRRYLGSGTPQRARHTFDEWLYNECYGTPSLEDINDYIVEKLLHMFEKGVFSAKVEHMQRAKRYAGEFDFDQLDDDHKLKKSVYKHYAALRKLVECRDGMLVVDAARAGQYFYASRHEENAKPHRNAFLKYMHKIDMAQQLRVKLLEEESAANRELNPQLNYFAPSKNLKVLLTGEWFDVHRVDQRYDHQWTDNFVNALMRSEHRDYIATQWSLTKRQDYIRGCVVGLLREGGVVKGSMDLIARSAGVCDNYRTFSKYMGQCRQEPYADWVLDYLKASA